MKKMLVALLVVSPLLAIGAVFFKIHALENQVSNYLNGQGYQTTDIKSVDGSFGKLPLFSVEVIFSDEPEIRYFYREEDGVAFQYSHSYSGSSSYKYQHAEELK